MVGGAALQQETETLEAWVVGDCLLKPAAKLALLAPPDDTPDVAADVIATARAAVGRGTLRELEAELRRGMITEALDRCDGNRRAAARLLGVSRQFLQHAIRRIEASGHPVARRVAQPRDGNP